MKKKYCVHSFPNVEKVDSTLEVLWYRGTYALLEEDMGLALIFDVEELLAAIGRVRDVQLEICC
jgi:hypothetical protein